jgi:hypothetical protein
MALVLEHPWVELIGEDPDYVGVRELIAELRAPFPGKLGDRPVVVTGPKTGVSIEFRPGYRGGHVVEAIKVALKPAPKHVLALPGDLVAGEARADVHARLGAPSYTKQDEDVWSLDRQRELRLRFERDVVVGLVMRYAD